MLKDKIKEHIDDFEFLEKLYRDNKKEFEKSFWEIYSEISSHESTKFWKTRFQFEKNENNIKVSKNEILLILISCIVTVFLIQIPHLFNFSPTASMFYEKNAGLIVFLGLTLYSFLRKTSLKKSEMIVTFMVFVISAIYVNFLPINYKSDSIKMALLHLPLMLWCVYGIVFIDFDKIDKSRRIDFIKYNGDLAVLVAVIAIAGGIFSGITIGLFKAIGQNIGKIYSDYVILSGVVSAPIIVTFVVSKYPNVANKISPIIAKIFSPIVLITLIVYLISIFVTGKNPYNDREFLIVFNAMLIGVMALIIFSVSETSSRKYQFNEITLFLLSIVTLILGLIALSAIIYRLSEFGFTSNRTVVLGSNLLILGNLLLIMYELYKVNFRKDDIKNVETIISKYLPVYAIWTVIVVFILPIIFGMK